MLSLRSIALFCGLAALSSFPIVSSCYCGIGFQSGHTPSGFDSSYASWSSPSAKGQALTSTSSPTKTAFMNGQTTLATGGLTWNTSPGNSNGNTYAVDGNPSSFGTKSWSSLGLPSAITSPLTGSPYSYPSTYYLTGILDGCVIPLGQSTFVTSIQFQPYSYYESGNTVSTYHADSVNSYVQANGQSLTSVPVFQDGMGYGQDHYFTGEFALTLGTNYFYIAVGNTDITHSTTGGCPFVYKYTITCTQSSVKGDPQFTGFLGQDYQIHGQSGTVYNILSTPSFQYNALFSFLSSGRCRIGTLCFSHPGNYFGAVGMLIRDQNDNSTTAIKVTAGSVDEGMKVSINDIPLSPSDHSLTIGYYTVQYPNLFELTIESDQLNLKLSNSDYFINQDVSIGTGLLSSIAEHKKMKRLNQTRADELEADLPHGLLGQTWQSKQHNNRWKFIAGHLYDYIVDGLTGQEFKYNRFQY